MKKKRLVNRKLKFSITIGILILLGGIFYSGLTHYLAEKIKLNKNAIAEKIAQELGMPIKFDAMEATWSGIFFGISLRNIQVIDPEVGVPFISFEKVDVFPELKSLFKRDEVNFRKVVMKGMKLVIGQDKSNNLTLLGLNKEDIPATIEYARLKELLAKLSYIVFKDAEFEWTGKNVQLKQLWSGQFSWVHSKEQDWSIKGIEQIQLRNGHYSPKHPFKLWITPLQRAIGIKVSLGGNQLECTLNLEGNVQVNCENNLQNLELLDIHKFYQPDQSHPAFIQWLSKTIKEGKIKSGKIQVKGPIQSLDWEGNMDFENVNFHYDDAWPSLTKAKGKILIQTEKIAIDLEEGQIMDLPIKTLSALITPLGESKVVNIKGQIDSTLEQGLLFLHNSPLNNLGHALEPLSPNGSMALALSLKIPLASHLMTEVLGNLTVKDGHLLIPESNHTLTGLNGNFEFTQNDVSSSNMKANFLNQAIDISVNTVHRHKSKDLNIHTSLNVSSELLQDTLSVPLSNFLEGQSLFDVVINFPIDKGLEQGYTCTINTKLQGMSLNLPGIIHKNKESVLPMQLMLVTSAKDHKNITLNLENLMDAKLIFRSKDKNLAIQQGHVVLGREKSNWNARKGLLISGNIPNFKLNEWERYLHELNDKHQKNTIPLKINLFVNDFSLYGLKFGKTWLMADISPTHLLVSLDGSIIKGNIHFKQNEKSALIVDLNYLHLTKDRIELNTSTATFNAKSIPIRFYCHDLRYQQKSLGQVSFSLVPIPLGYKIEGLLMETPFSTVTGAGEWHMGSVPYTHLQGEIVSTNMGKLFSSWDYPTAIRESKGYIKYHFKWPRAPYQFSVDSINGDLELKIEKGRILGVNQGIGRILGLLNLQSIQRRLQLDFSDLLKKGFFFDKMKGFFVIKEGIATTDKLSIAGPSANIEISGNANFSNKFIDLNMTVIPQVGLPIAAGIALANPAAGFGVWILDKVTGSKITRITRNHYQVTGTWDAPSIQEESAFKKQK